jgi:integral membrane sensor domain MASE1
MLTFHPRLKYLLALATLAASYFVTGKLGLQLASLHPSATAVWPPAGIALAALLVGGYGLWPGVLVGSFLADLTTSGNIVSSLAIAGGSALEALAGAYLVNRFANGRRAFERPLALRH